MSGFSPRTILAFDQDGLRALNELMQELARGINDAHVSGAAKIQMSKLLRVDLGVLDLSTTERAIAHKLPFAPTHIEVRPTTAFTWFESSPATRDRIYLTASATGRASVVVGV